MVRVYLEWTIGLETPGALVYCPCPRIINRFSGFIDYASLHRFISEIKPTVYFGEPVLDKDTLVHWVRMIHQR